MVLQWMQYFDIITTNIYHIRDNAEIILKLINFSMTYMLDFKYIWISLSAV